MGTLNSIGVCLGVKLLDFEAHAYHEGDAYNLGSKSMRSLPPTKPRKIRAKPPSSRGKTTPSTETRIGVRLRHARLTKGLSLRQLADQVDCSESFISKVENDKVRPSFSMLHRIVAALEMNVAALFAEAAPEFERVTIMKPSNRPVIRVDPVWRGEGIALERLIPSAKGTLLQANIHHIDPGANTDGAIDHDGEELGYVLEGKLLLVVDGVSYLVHPGESFFFASHLPHSYSNPGKTVTKVLWVNTPPTF